MMAEKERRLTEVYGLRGIMSAILLAAYVFSLPITVLTTEEDVTTVAASVATEKALNNTALTGICKVDNESMQISDINLDYIVSSKFLQAIQPYLPIGVQADILRGDGKRYASGNVQPGDRLRLMPESEGEISFYTIVGIEARMQSEAVFAPTDVTSNIAYNKSPMDTYAKDNQPACLPEAALDGLLNTSWAGKDTDFKIDLGRQGGADQDLSVTEHMFNMVRIYPPASYADRTVGANAAYSNDATNWTTFASKHREIGLWEDGEPVDFLLPTPVTARYVKVGFTMISSVSTLYVGDIQVYHVATVSLAASEIYIVDSSAEDFVIIKGISSGTSVAQFLENILYNTQSQEAHVEREKQTLNSGAMIDDGDVLVITDMKFPENIMNYDLVLGGMPQKPSEVEVFGTVLPGNTITAQALDGKTPIEGENVRFDWWMAEKLEGPYCLAAANSAEYTILPEDLGKIVKVDAVRAENEGTAEAPNIYYSDAIGSVYRVGDMSDRKNVDASSGRASASNAVTLSEQYWSPAAEDSDKWLSVDLGALDAFSKIVLDFFEPQNVGTYALEYSEDGTVWAKLAATGIAGVGESAMFEPITARYIRVKLDTDGRNAGIRHLSVYNIPMLDDEAWNEAVKSTEAMLMRTDAYTKSNWSQTMQVMGIGASNIISWTSSNPKVKFDDGKAYLDRPKTDEKANIEAVITLGSRKATLRMTKTLLGTDKGSSGGGSREKTGASAGSISVAHTPAPNVEPVLRDIEKSWAKEYIEELYAAGIVSGTEGGNFEPQREINREEFVKLLVAAFGLLDKNAKTSMKDTSPGEWHYAYIASAQQHNIVQGMEDGTFGVGRPITREQMATMAYRAATEMGIRINAVCEPVTFMDDELISEYAKQAIRNMQTGGIISGMENECFGPHLNTTREQSAKIIYILWKYK